MLKVKLPRTSWSGVALEAIYDLLQGRVELGFLRREVLRDHVRANEYRGTIWAAYLGDSLVGAALIGSRRSYPHLLRHGEIYVLKPYRRRRIGTTFYFTQVLQALLEGRREVEDTIVPDYSPWMIGPTECGGLGFLPSLSYSRYGILPRRTSGFKDVELWGKLTTEVRDFTARLPSNFVIELVDTPAVRETFSKNFENYRRHDVKLAEEIFRLRKWVFEVAQVHSTEAGHPS